MRDNTSSDDECSGSEEETYSSDNRDSDRNDDGRRKVTKENAVNTSRKRPYDDDDDDAGEQFRAKRVARIRDVVFRVVVPSHEIGKVIGKQGAKIKVLREETGAKIKIADPVAPQEERVIIISSKDEEKEDKSAAENALIRIITAILEESGGSATTTKAVSRHVGPNMTRLLIGGSQAGSLIGMSGNTIKKIRKDSGASVQVMPQNLLPFCASASETDRLVQISGELSQVLKALDYIGSTLRENPPKEVISMRPTYYVPPSAANKLMLFPRSALPRYTMQSGNFSSPHSRAAGKAVHGVSTISGASASFPRVTVEITIPSDVVGGLIGKGGSNISKVRSVSGATVKITGNKDFETRTIYFEGTSEQVAIAQNLVNSFINVQQQT
ncbi:hypothetical protein SUGI_0580380 [Cryptomeria japonica]|uniref:uncharacterized protein LOC131069598 n=1 Tax=Cryptomeria japonica TaxID=3369 RepID=UPI0024147279|nr:uncharacterized protein LOC131069598 [Cryptomeria japonica]GLJ29439.1 hypothetical protein SUGI_0580380 [Cryptomeria japonica]